MRKVLALALFSLLFLNCTAIKTSSSVNTKQTTYKWTPINGKWDTDNNTLNGQKNEQWAIINLNKRLPDNYSITFSSKISDDTHLFEVILDLKKQAFVGILYNTLDKKIKIEDRKLYSAKEIEKEKAYIRTKGNIGQLPKFELTPSTEWVNWKIEKRNNELYIWINEEEYVHYRNEYSLLQAKGQLGFAINGKASIKDIVIKPIQQDDLLTPIEFKEKPKILPFFLFS